MIRLPLRVMLVFMLVLALIQPMLSAPVEALTTEKGITTVNLNVRTSPSTSGTLITTLKTGTEVQYTKYNSSWHRVYIGSKSYYASAQYIKPISTNEWKNGTTTANLNVRATPSTQGQYITTLKSGTNVAYKLYNSSWLTIRLNGNEYFVSSAYVKESQTTTTTTRSGVTTENLNIRTTASLNGSIVTTLPKGSDIEFAPYNDSWVKVFLNGKVYYAAKAYVSETPIAQVETAVMVGYTNTPNSTLNVRASADTTAVILGKLPHGTKVESYGLVNDFYKISYSGKVGYVHSSYVISTTPTPVTTNAPVIIIDAGHGGHDPGAMYGSFYEKMITLDVAQKIESYLQSTYGYNVKLTRNTDVYLTLEQRVLFAGQQKGDLFVSIHVNSAMSELASGIEVFYPETQNPHIAESGLLSQALQNQLVEALPLTDRGVRQADFYVLRTNTMPASLVELGFLSSSYDRTYLMSEAYRQQMANAVARGIASYVRSR